MKITLEYCKNCRGFFNKIGSYIQWFLVTHSILTLCILLVSAVTFSFLCFENSIKDSLIYPAQKYTMLEDVAYKHSNKKQNLADISDLPQNINFDISINKDKIISKYYVEYRYNVLFDFIGIYNWLEVTVEQESSNFEIVNIKRNFEENNFVSEIRKGVVLLFTIFFFFILFIFMLIILKVLELLNNIGLEKRRKKYTKELNTLEKASEVLNKHDTD